MSYWRLVRFLPTKEKIIGVCAATFVFLLISTESVCFCAQPQQNPATPAGPAQDANSAAASAPNVPEIPTAPVTETAAPITVDKLEAKKKEISDSKELSDELKTKITDTYDKAISQLKSATAFEAAKQKYSEERKNAPETLAKIKEQLAAQTAAPPEALPDITLAQAEQSLTAAKLALEDAKKNVAKWEDEPKKRAERRTKIPEETNTAKQKLEEVKTKLAAPAPEGQAAQLTEANRALLLAQQRALQAQIDANTEELLFYDAAGDLLAARRDLAARQQTQAQNVVDFWQQKVDGLRQKQAQAAQKEAIRAKEETKFEAPAIKAVAEKNVELAKLQAKLVSEIQTVDKYSEQIDANLTEIKKSFGEIRAKVETAGRVTDAMGMILLHLREKLPNISSNLRRMRARPAEIALAQFDEMERDKQWSELSDLTDEVNAVLAELGPSVSDTQREAIKKQVTSYYESQRTTLQNIADDYGDYAGKLANLDAKEREYVKTVRQYADFLDANILWVRSSPVLRLSDLIESAAAIGWLVSPVNWYKTATVLWADFRANILTYVAVILICISMFMLRPRARDGLKILAGKVHEVQTDSFVHTIKAVGLTIFLASGWPVVLFLLQWRLSVSAGDYDYPEALAAGLRVLVPVVFVLSFLQRFAAANGVAQDHLRMRSEPLSYLRRWLRPYFAVAVVTTFVVAFMQAQRTGEQWYNSAGRLFLMAGLIALALLVLVLLRPTGPLVEAFLRQRREGWLDRLRYVWYTLCFVLPAAFAVLAGMGYFYAARELYEKFVFTLLVILLAILIRAMFVRWLMVAQRRLALLERQKREAEEQERQKREAEEQEAQEKGEAPASPEPQSGKGKDEATIFQVSRQTRRLIDAFTVFLPLGGIWYIWSDFLPALGSVAATPLWTVTAEKNVTIGSVAIALFIVVLTVILTRNVPGLLEIVVLRQLPIDRAVRFAVITVFRYMLAVVGIALAFTEIGIGWSKIQWLIAAMGVGLGFGLQEIFANFISGLIILFEQPVRVDDTVTIGEVTGKVSQIRIRATTIRRWDQRELIVPNKEFITGHLINWTLSDNVLRREFVVGIAYGSDIAKAEKILYDIARANPLVLKEPTPVVIFKDFGNSTLDFELRVYISGIDNYVPVWHGINCTIDEEFRKAGIEISFPQQDLHIRSVDRSIPIDINKPQV
jgi:potassium efflux system protein